MVQAQTKRIAGQHNLDFGAIMWFAVKDMNKSLVKSVPQGDFVEVSVLKQGWESEFQMLVGQNRPIKYDMYPRMGIPSDIENDLNQNGYHDLILENDRWQHFLVPNPN
jgi:hypothetical protein